jgi:hypothetical protein
MIFIYEDYDSTNGKIEKDQFDRSTVGVSFEKK